MDLYIHLYEYIIRKNTDACAKSQISGRSGLNEGRKSGAYDHQSTAITGVRTPTRWNRSAISLLAMRMQP